MSIKDWFKLPKRTYYHFLPTKDITTFQLAWCVAFSFWINGRNGQHEEFKGWDEIKRFWILR